MTCRDFEHAWNDRLDGRAPLAPAVAAALEGHAAHCPSCRELGRRFETLQQAIFALGPPPEPSAGLAERIAARAREEVSPAWPSSLGSVPIRLAMAAAVLLAVGIGLRARWPARRDARAPGRPVARRTLPLTTAVALATSGTVDLAREAGAPAARVGRRALDATTLPSRPAVGAVSVGPASQVLDVVDAGIRPLSGSARHAFAFLIRPAPAPKVRPAAARVHPRPE